MDGRVINTFLRCDVENGGAYQITGQVTRLGSPGAYQVRLFDSLSGVLRRETWSTSAGIYLFPYIAYRFRGYFAIAYDHGDNPLNAGISALISPEPMP